MKKVLFFLMMVAVALVSCEDPDGPQGNKPGNSDALDTVKTKYTLTVDKDQVALFPNEEHRINFTLSPDANVDFEFISSNEQVATVSAGLIKSVAEGTATITVRVKGYETISADINVTVFSADDPIAKVEFYNVELYGFYPGRQYPLSFMRGEIDENGDTIYKESNDINNDGEGDYARECAMYVVAKGVYMDQYGLTGEENYVIFIHSVCPYDGKYVYPVAFYQFSADQDSFLIEHDGNKFLRWTQDVAYATYTNFNAVSYSKYYHNVLFSNGEWPASQEEYDAFMDEYGYILGDYDSYVGYLRIPEGSEAWVQEPAGLVTGGIGFYFDLDDENKPQMPFLDVDLEFFTNLDAYGLALEQAKDEEGNLIWYDPATDGPTTENTGEPWLTYSTEGEGDAETCIMAPTLKRHFRIDKLASEEQQAPRRAFAPEKRISEKRIMANTLLNIPMKNILLKK